MTEDDYWNAATDADRHAVYMRALAAIKDKQECIDYWGKRSEKAESALQQIVDFESNRAISGSGLFMRSVVIARQVLKAAK